MRWLAVGVVAVAPVVAAFALSRTGDHALEDLSPAWTPVFFPITTNTLEVSTHGTLTASVEPSAEIVSTTQEGTVTAIWIEPGESLVAGERVLDIDGAGVVGYIPSQGAVFYRDLCRGDSGADVVLLQRLLATQGRYSGSIDGNFGIGTEAAVRAFDRALGVPEPSGCFSLVRVVALPIDGVIVGEVEIGLGSRIDVGVTSLAKAAPVVSNIELDTPVFTGPDGDYFVVLGGRSIAVTRSSGGWVIETGEIAAALVAVTPTDGGVEVTVGVHSAQAMALQVMPSAAGFVTSDGALCIGLEPRLPGGDIELLPIRPVSASTVDGIAITPIPELEGRMVLANPPPDLSEHECH
jgi:peptidoglycan hydrolase-like protein with peptidoglycan-binding domain